MTSRVTLALTLLLVTLELVCGRRVKIVRQGKVADVLSETKFDEISTTTRSPSRHERSIPVSTALVFFVSFL